jgi:hypothetical protein
VRVRRRAVVSRWRMDEGREGGAAVQVLLFEGSSLTLRTPGHTLHTPRPSLPPQIRSEYMSVMSRILSSHFRTYLSGMEKMLSALAHESDVLGVNEGGGSVGMLTGLFSKAARGQTSVSGGGARRVFQC